MAQGLSEKFKETASLYPDRVAIQYKELDEWIDILYSGLGRDVESLVAFLMKEGIGKNDKVAILLDNRPEWPAIFFATISVGAVSIPLNPDSTTQEIENILRDSESKIIFTSDGTLLEKASSVKSASLKKTFSVDSDQFKDALKFSEKTPYTKIEISQSDLACILYTSGTTDQPKGVMLSHANLASNCESLYKVNVVTPEDLIISILPLHHAYPLTVTMLLPLLYGGRIIYPGTMRVEEILKAMQEKSPTVFVAVPQIFYSFHKKIKESFKGMPFPLGLVLSKTADFLYWLRGKTALNLSRYLFYGLHMRFGKAMRLFVSGGAKLNEVVERDLFKFGFTIIEGYGLTETSPVLSLNPPKRPKLGSVGFAVPGVELKIGGKDEKGVGEVIARGPNIMEGYYKRKDLTDEVIKDGWFHTGDLGYFDEDGYLFLTGRSKEVIVLSSGLNIYPDEIEEAYSKRAPVKEMCVFEVPAKKGEEESLVLWAVVVPDLEYFRKYGEINLRIVFKERFDNVSRTLPPYKRLMGFSIILEPLPRTLLGKIKRFVVKEIYTPKVLGEKELAPARRELSKEDLEILESECGKKIVEYLKRQTKVERPIAPADLLELDLGIDSLGRIELASGLESVFNIEIKDEIIGKSFTVRDLITGVESLLRGPEKVLPPEEKEISFGPEYWKKLFEVPPKKENLEKIDLKPGFLDWLGCFLFLLPYFLIFKIFYNLRVEGRDNLPKSGPFILYANHTSYLDGFLAAVSLPNFPDTDLFFVGFRPYLNVPVIRNLIKIGRVIPLDFSSHLLEALRSAYYVLKNGKSLCLFPEGIRSLDGNVREFKRGFGILVKESGAKLVPVAISGAYEAWPRTAKFPKPHPIKVKFGHALSPEDLEAEGLKMGAKDGYSAICIAARNALIKLKEER